MLIGGGGGSDVQADAGGEAGQVGDVQEGGKGAHGGAQQGLPSHQSWEKWWVHGPHLQFSPK